MFLRMVNFDNDDALDVDKCNIFCDMNDFLVVVLYLCVQVVLVLPD